jgi:transcriptional antiterminator NusG
MPEIDNAHNEVEQTQASEDAASDPTSDPKSDLNEDTSARDDFSAAVEENAAPEAPLEDVVAAEPGAEPEFVSDAEETKHWYIIHTYSGFERKVAESLRTRAEAFGFSEQIGQILIPEEEVVELRNGKKVTSKRLLYPGYVVVQMEMNDELWHRVKDTPRVTGFVGGGQTPVPLSADEINKMLYRQTTAAERPRPKMTFE